LLSFKRALLIFIEHRREVIRRRSEFDLAKTKARAHILEGLRIALSFLDQVIAIIRNAPDAETAKAELIARLSLTDLQAQAILDMQLRRLAALERQKIEDEYQECLRTIAYLEDLLANPVKVLALIKEDALKLAEKYGDARRTRIVSDAREDFDDEELIPDKSVLISLTEQGYIKRTPVEAYRAQSRGGRGVSGMTTKEEDEVIFLFSARTHDTVLFFTNRGKAYALKAHQIPEADRAAKGTYLANLISIGEREKVTAALPIPKALFEQARNGQVADGGGEDDAGDVALLEGNDGDAQVLDEAGEVAPPSNGSYAPTVAMCTRMGKIKRVDLSVFANIRSNGLLCMTLSDEDELSYVRLTPGNGELMLVTAQGQALRFSETLVRRMGRAASGVRPMRFKMPGDYIAGMEVVEPGGFLLTVTANGYGKCTSLDEYGTKGRGGSGMRTMSGALEVTGELVAARVVQPDDQVTIISANGAVLRQRVSDIPKTGRATRGSRLITLREGDVVASVARLTRVD
jgi:DNA gyrase subunit A